jgi:WD40 repeat protein
VKTWNVETKQIVNENIHFKGAWKCSYFPDSKRFAVSASSTQNPIVKVFEAETGKEILTLKGHEKRVRAVDVSPDGKIIATGSQDGSVRIWNAEAGKELHKFDFATKDKGTEILDVNFSVNGDQLVAVGFETLVSFDTKTWQKKIANLDEFKEKNLSLFGWKVIFSPDEKLVAVGNYYGEVILLDSDKLNIIKVIRNHQANVKTLGFSANGKILATGSWDRTVKFFDVESGNLINELKGHFAGIHEIAFSPNGKILATASGDFNVNLWNTEKVANSDAILINSSFTAISNSGKFVVSWNSANGDLGSWNLQTREQIWSAKTSANVFSIDISETADQIILGDREGYIFLISLSDGRELRRFRLREKTIFGVRFSLDGKNSFVAYDDGIIQSVNLENQNEIFNIKAHENNFKPLAISPNGKYFASGGNDKLVKIFDVSGKEIFSFKENLKPLYVVVFSADSSLLASVGADDKARIWRVSDGKFSHELSGMSAGIFAVTFSPDGKRLATASDVGVIRLWDVENGKQVFSFSASQKQINQLKFSEDGKTLMSIDTGGKVNFLRTAN